MDIGIIGKLKIELYLLLKICFDYSQEKLKYVKVGKQRALHFEFHCQKLSRLYHNTYILLFCIDLSTKPDWGL